MLSDDEIKAIEALVEAYHGNAPHERRDPTSVAARDQEAGA